MGDPLNEENDLGPMARFDLRDELHQQVEATLPKGAVTSRQGKIAGHGNYYAVTVLGDVTPEMTAFRRSCWSGCGNYCGEECGTCLSAGE